MSPRLSVIIPVRNGADFIARAIAAAQSIPIQPLEIVVVDDGSTDGTIELLQWLAKGDSRIVVVRRYRDHGVSAARNEGIAKANADIVCFLDADDVLYPEAIAKRLEWHEAHPDVVLSFANYETLLPDGTVEPRFSAYWPRFMNFVGGREGMIDLGDDAFALLFGENPVCTTGSMARRTKVLSLGGFSRDLRQAEDWDLWIRLSQHGRVAYSTKPEGRHTARHGSLSTDAPDRTAHIAEVVRRHRRHAMSHAPLAACLAMSTVQIAQAELARLEGHDFIAWWRYLAGFFLHPSRRLLRDFARQCAVLVGLRSGRIESFEERARLAASR